MHFSTHIHNNYFTDTEALAFCDGLSSKLSWEGNSGYTSLINEHSVIFKRLMLVLYPVASFYHTKCTCTAFGFGFLTNWGRDKMGTISQMTFSNVFSWMSYWNFD